MTMRIGINGLGRMGKLALRVARENENWDVVHINEPNADAMTSAHLIEFDSCDPSITPLLTASDGKTCCKLLLKPHLG